MQSAVCSYISVTVARRIHARVMSRVAISAASAYQNYFPFDDVMMTTSVGTGSNYNSATVKDNSTDIVLVFTARPYDSAV